MSFVMSCAKKKTKGLLGQRCAVSGSGNVSQYLCEKLLELGAIPISVSDSAGTLFVGNGISKALLKDIMELKNVL